MLEERFDTTIDEPAFASARTIGDLEALVRQAASAPSAMTRAPEGGPAERPERITFPAWNRGRLARAVRRVNLAVWLLPRAALPSRTAHDAASSDDPPDLLSRGPLVQRVSAATARGWCQGHASLHWGACQCGPVDPDLSRRNAD